MKVQLSPLVLLDFAILKSSFKFSTAKQETNIRDIAASYELDIDFAILKESDNSTRIFIKSAINQGKSKLPGYSIFAEGVAVFNLSKEVPLSKEDKNSLLQYSAVSIALNSLRGFIASLTANAPFGRYILPSIDVNDLFKQKLKATQMKEIKSKRNKKVTNKSKA